MALITTLSLIVRLKVRSRCNTKAVAKIIDKLSAVAGASHFYCNVTKWNDRQYVVAHAQAGTSIRGK